MQVAPSPPFEVGWPWVGSAHVWMLFGAELMSLSEYPQLLLVHVYTRRRRAGGLRRSLVYSQDIREEKRAVDISRSSIGRPLADSEEGREGGREAREEVVDVK